MDQQLECLPHPIYSPEFATCDIHLIGSLKELLGRKKFDMDEEIKEVMQLLPNKIGGYAAA